MYLAGVTVSEGLPAALAVDWLVAGVQLLHVYAQVRLATALGRAQLARVHWLSGNCEKRYISYPARNTGVVLINNAQLGGASTYMNNICMTKKR